jgi:hypothetical protein
MFSDHFVAKQNDQRKWEMAGGGLSNNKKRKKVRNGIL